MIEHEAGRELDALIAERLMGWHREIDLTYDYDRVQHKNEVLLPPGLSLEMVRDTLPPRGRIPFAYFLHQHYSTDIAAAWSVVEALRARGIGLIVKAYPKGRGMAHEYTAHCPDTGITIAAPTAPLVICRIALAAMEAQR